MAHRHSERSEVVENDEPPQSEPLARLGGGKLPDVIRHANDVAGNGTCDREGGCERTMRSGERADGIQVVFHRGDEVGIVGAGEHLLVAGLAVFDQREPRVRAADIRDQPRRLTGTRRHQPASPSDAGWRGPAIRPRRPACERADTPAISPRPSKCRMMRRASSSAARFRLIRACGAASAFTATHAGVRRWIERPRQRERARKQRSGVTVFAHAQHNDVERPAAPESTRGSPTRRPLPASAPGSSVR